MRFFLLFPAAALLAATALHSPGWASVETEQAAVAGRQKIREELALAMTDGHISRMDQYHILLHAKEVLTPEDLRGLEKTLDRIAVADAPHTRRKLATEGGMITGDPSERPKAAPISHEKMARLASLNQQIEEGGAGKNESPFVEEVPKPEKQGYSDETNNPNEDETLSCDPSGSDGICGCGCGPCRLANLDLSTGVDSFKGPEDLGNANGNFGTRFGVNAGIPLAQRMGIGIQAGVNEILSDLKGTPYPVPGSQIRFENFATVGAFQRISVGEGSIGWGFVYDWFFDNYYSDFHFGQWRVKLAYEMNPCNEFGIIAAMHDKGDSGELVSDFGITDVSFKPIDQGSVYWKHTWENDASLTGRFGVAETPSQFVFGFDGRVPISERVAFTGGATYVMPVATGGLQGQTQDIWNVSVGLEFVPGGIRHGCAARFTPFIPVADNGSFSLKETQ